MPPKSAPRKSTSTRSLKEKASKGKAPAGGSSKKKASKGGDAPDDGPPGPSPHETYDDVEAVELPETIEGLVCGVWYHCPAWGTIQRDPGRFPLEKRCPYKFRLCEDDFHDVGNKRVFKMGGPVSDLLKKHLLSFSCPLKAKLKQGEPGPEKDCPFSTKKIKTSSASFTEIMEHQGKKTKHPAGSVTRRNLEGTEIPSHWEGVQVYTWYIKCPICKEALEVPSVHPSESVHKRSLQNDLRLAVENAHIAFGKCKYAFRDGNPMFRKFNKQLSMFLDLNELHYTIHSASSSILRIKALSRWFPSSLNTASDRFRGIVNYSTLFPHAGDGAYDLAVCCLLSNRGELIANWQQPMPEPNVQKLKDVSAIQISDNLKSFQFECPYYGCISKFRTTTRLDLALFYYHLRISSENMCGMCPEPAHFELSSSLWKHEGNPSIHNTTSERSADPGNGLVNYDSEIAKVLNGKSDGRFLSGASVTDWKYPDVPVGGAGHSINLEHDYTELIKAGLEAQIHNLVRVYIKDLRSTGIRELSDILNTLTKENDSEPEVTQLQDCGLEAYQYLVRKVLAIEGFAEVHYAKLKKSLEPSGALSHEGIKTKIEDLILEERITWPADRITLSETEGSYINLRDTISVKGYERLVKEIVDEKVDELAGRPRSVSGSEKDAMSAPESYASPYPEAPSDTESLDEDPSDTESSVSGSDSEADAMSAPESYASPSRASEAPSAAADTKSLDEAPSDTEGLDEADSDAESLPEASSDNESMPHTLSQAPNEPAKRRKNSSSGSEGKPPRKAVQAKKPGIAFTRANESNA
ncbi:hypothetical protein BJ508DRAFT_333274 [Ascobolus immersus RN42]|uniref:Uncharacterized protein n=1 Tax=Ascobolus immersus RN42 TaxID=1160509 RepID=A0A3N4HLX9_ASCIM|nr:hypothetical protein BJ508DRAFT_333274 [Ascobolus immersus RN42]